MSYMIFDGRGFANKIAERLRDEVIKLDRKPKLVAIVDPTNVAGVKYYQLKAKMAQKLGVEFTIYTSPQPSPKLGEGDPAKLEGEVLRLNVDPTINGIVIQLPFPNSRELIDLIDPRKDVDGLREDSPFQPAVVRAVTEILGDSFKESPFKAERRLLVGSRGFVGSRLVRELNCQGLDIGDDLNKLKDADVIISCTGQPGLIKPDMVKNGFVAIDVGYPEAEFTPAALAKASFYTPVPGGVGPVTVVMLFANLLESCK